MKKKNLKNLTLSKITVSSLEIVGGYDVPRPPSLTCMTWCGGTNCVTAVPSVTCIAYCGGGTQNQEK